VNIDWKGMFKISGVSRNFFGRGGGVTPGIFSGRGATNSVEDRGQRFHSISKSLKPVF
jgi:hypothetical protein